MRLTALFAIAVLPFLLSCNKEDVLIRHSTDETVDVRGTDCPVFPPGTVNALAPLNEVEILESNSDFINHIYLVSPIEMFIGTDDELEKIVALPAVMPHTELIFEIRVHAPDGTPLGVSWQTGPASRNTDGAVHAIIQRCPMRMQRVNFEDIDASAWGTDDEPNYVDAVFVVRPQ